MGRMDEEQTIWTINSKRLQDVTSHGIKYLQ